MCSLRRQNTLYGFDSSLTNNGSIATISNGMCPGWSCNNATAIGHHHDPTREPSTQRTDEQNGFASGAAPFERGISFRLSKRSQIREMDNTAEPCSCEVSGEKAKKKIDMKMRRLGLLVIAFVAYVSLGAILFKMLESGPELERKESLENFIEEFLTMYPCVNRSSIYELMMKSVVDSEIVYYVVENKTSWDRWDFSGSFGFVVSVVTTIGFGNFSPFTLTGKGVCVVYAMVGIPLTLMVLSGIGEKMAHGFTRFRKTRFAMCHQSPVINKRINVVCVAVIGIIIIFIIPAVVFSYVEQWHFLEALYFCFTTLSTVGFGDYVIGLHEKRLTNVYTHGIYVVASYIWVLLGLAYLSLVYRVVTDKVVASAKRVERKTIRKLGPEYVRKIGESLMSTSSTQLSNYSNNNNSNNSSNSSNNTSNPLRTVDESDQITVENECPAEGCQHL